jgi:HNH endonuclease/RuvC endonuclease subdomain 3
LQRLLRGILKEFAQNQPECIADIVVEVNRDLKEFSGMTAKEIAQDFGQRLAHFKNTAEWLEEKLAGETYHGRPIRITAGLIRKARVAEDLGWKCPYTGMMIEPKQLVTGDVDLDHVVPRSQRYSDSLDSLVVTFKEVNRMKGKRTALQFMQEFQSQAVLGLSGKQLQPLSLYREAVEKMDVRKGHPEDQKRKKRRQRLLLLERWEEKEFLPRDLTQTSHLARLGAQMLHHHFKDLAQKPHIHSLPGSITGTVRKGWRVNGCLGLACPEALDENGDGKPKGELREITHLHHALDACVLGLTARFLPNRGDLWQLMIKPRVTPAEAEKLRDTGCYQVDPEGRPRLIDLPDQVKEQLRKRLAERRVMQHLPKSMDGMRAELTTWRVLKIEGEIAYLQQVAINEKGDKKIKNDKVKISKLVGLKPGKLQLLKGAIVIGDNFGVALDPSPVVLPHRHVWRHLQEMKDQNGGRFPRVLRNGQIIRITKEGKRSDYRGYWRVTSVKDNASGLAIDIVRLHAIKAENKSPNAAMNVALETLIQCGLEIPSSPYTGLKQ